MWDNILFNSGLLSKVNPSAEAQKAIDIFSKDAFVEALTSTGVDSPP